MTPFYGWGSTAWRLQNHYKEAAYFLSLSSQRFVVLIWLTLEGWKAELSLKPPSGFEHRTPGLGIQHPNPAGIQHLNVFVLLNNQELNICLKQAEIIFNSDIFLIEKGDSGRSPHPTRHFVTLPSKKNIPTLNYRKLNKISLPNVHPPNLLSGKTLDSMNLLLKS